MCYVSPLPDVSKRCSNVYLVGPTCGSVSQQQQDGFKRLDEYFMFALEMLVKRRATHTRSFDEFRCRDSVVAALEHEASERINNQRAGSSGSMIGVCLMPGLELS
jgi:hypothetical protein